jgi:hypothetical protein
LGALSANPQSFLRLFYPTFAARSIRHTVERLTPAALRNLFLHRSRVLAPRLDRRRPPFR